MKSVPSLETADEWMSCAKRINPQREPLTVDKLREFPGFENYTDEQATQAIQSIEQLAFIIYECTSQNNIICIDNQQVVYLEESKQAA
jgi:hypothetical protein